MARVANYNRDQPLRVRKPFVEDPDKAVFLSGFREDIPQHQWKSYREEVYQCINKDYGVYITKLDLPVNCKFGYLHMKNHRDAQKLLSLRPCEDDVGSDNEGAPHMKLAGGIIHVFTYKKTQKRRIEERSGRMFGNSRGSTRPSSPQFNRGRDNRRYDEDRAAEREDHRDRAFRSNKPLKQFTSNPLQVPDSAFGTHDQSRDDLDSNRSKESDKSEEHINYQTPEEPTSIEEPEVELPQKVTIAATQLVEPNFTVNPLAETTPSEASPKEADSRESIGTVIEQAQEPVSQEGIIAFEDITRALNTNTNYANILLENHWDARFNTWPDTYQIFLMVIFMQKFTETGPDAAVEVINAIKITAEQIEQEENVMLLQQNC